MAFGKIGFPGGGSPVVVSGGGTPSFTGVIGGTSGSQTFGFGTDVSHNLDTMYPEVRIWDGEHFPVVPNEIIVLDSNNIEIRFVEPQEGTIVIYKVV